MEGPERFELLREPCASVRFRTKPQFAQTMLTRALAGGSCPRWVLGDEVYGNHRAFRQRLEQQRLPLGALREPKPRALSQWTIVGGASPRQGRAGHRVSA